MTRRDFLTGLAGGLIASHFPVFGIEGETSVPVVVQGTPEAAVRCAVNLLGGMSRFVSSGDTVLLKPNLSFPSPPEFGATTNPLVVAAVSKLALEAGAQRVIIADNTMRDGDLCFQRSGLPEIIPNTDPVTILPLQRESYFESVQVRDGQALKEVRIAKLLRRSVLINLPCAKSHNATDVSFGIKNLMGLIWDRSYFHQATDLHRAIAELATVIKPRLTLLDATRALVTGGPTGPGKVIEPGLVIAGTDPLAVDAYAVSLAPWNGSPLIPENIKHIHHAALLGVGRIPSVHEISIQRAQ